MPTRTDLLPTMRLMTYRWSRVLSLVIISALLIDPAWTSGGAPTSSVASPVNLFRQEALSNAALSALRLDRLMPVLDKSFGRLFGNVAGYPLAQTAMAGLAGLNAPLAFSPVGDFQFGSGAGPESKRPASDEPAHLDLSDAEAQASLLAKATIKLYDDLNKAGASVTLDSFLNRLVSIRSQVDALVPPPAEPRTVPPGYSRTLARRIDQKSKDLREAVSKRDEETLDALNLETRTLVAERIHLQLASAERELRRNHRTIALSSLFGAAKSLWRLRIEYFWARVRLFRRANLGDFLSLEGILDLKSFLTSGAWLGQPVHRKEGRQVLVDPVKRIWQRRKVDVTYRNVPKFLKGQHNAIKDLFQSAVEVLYQMAYIRYVQLLTEFRPGIQDLRKAQRDTRVVTSWAAKGTGDIRQHTASHLARTDVWFDAAIQTRGKPDLSREYDTAFRAMRNDLQAARAEVSQRLPDVRLIRSELTLKIHKLIAPFLSHDPSAPLPPETPADLRRSA